MSFPAFLSWACRNVVGGIIFLLAHPFLSETPRGQTQTPSRPSEQHRAISLAWDMHMIVFADVPMLPPCILHTLQSASRCLPPPSGLGGATLEILPSHRQFISRSRHQTTVPKGDCPAAVEVLHSKFAVVIRRLHPSFSATAMRN